MPDSTTAAQAPAAPSLRSITEEMLRGYWERDEERKALERKARQIEAGLKAAAEHIEAALKAEERVEVVRGEFRAGFVAGAAYVAWKNEFIKALGADKAGAIQQAAAPSRRLTVTRIGG
jgi:hypothetical protein